MESRSLFSLADLRQRCVEWRSVWPNVAGDGDALVVMKNGEVEALIEAVEAALHVPLPEAQQNPWQNRLANALERFREW